jgi:hypothetical protein
MNRGPRGSSTWRRKPRRCSSALKHFRRFNWDRHSLINVASSQWESSAVPTHFPIIFLWIFLWNTFKFSHSLNARWFSLKGVSHARVISEVLAQQPYCVYSRSSWQDQPIYRRPTYVLQRARLCWLLHRGVTEATWSPSRQFPVIMRMTVARLVATSVGQCEPFSWWLPTAATALDCFSCWQCDFKLDDVSPHTSTTVTLEA